MYWDWEGIILLGSQEREGSEKKREGREEKMEGSCRVDIKILLRELRREGPEKERKREPKRKEGRRQDMRRRCAGTWKASNYEGAS